jgi:hypothetical protein
MFLEGESEGRLRLGQRNLGSEGDGGALHGSAMPDVAWVGRWARRLMLKSSSRQASQVYTVHSEMIAIRYMRFHLNFSAPFTKF